MNGALLPCCNREFRAEDAPEILLTLVRWRHSAAIRKPDRVEPLVERIVLSQARVRQQKVAFGAPHLVEAYVVTAACSGKADACRDGQ